MAGSPQHDLSLIDRATSVRGQARSIVQQAAHLPHRLGRHPDSGKCSDGQHLGQPSGIHAIGVAAGAQALEIHGIGEEDPVDVTHVAGYRPSRLCRLGSNVAVGSRPKSFRVN